MSKLTLCNQVIFFDVNRQKQNLNQLATANQSCSLLSVPASNTSSPVSLKPESCLKIADGICKTGSLKPVFRPYSNLFLDSILKVSSVVGFYSHPMNSITTCMAYCAAKTGTKTITVQGKYCACSSGECNFFLYYVWFNKHRGRNCLNLIFNFSKILSTCWFLISFSRKGLLGTMLTTGNIGTSCDLFISCPGNPLEQCGCRQYFNQTKKLPLVADVANLGKISYKNNPTVRNTNYGVSFIFILKYFLFFLLKI